MVDNKNVINLAKGSKPFVKKTTAKKSATKKPVAKSVEKKLTPEEERDLKAKETVQKLLEDSPIVTLDKKEDELLELEELQEEPKGVEWLEEQLTLLTEKNDELNAENDVLKQENQQLKVNAGSENGDIKVAVLQLFNEIQENHIKLGVNEQGVGNFRIYCPGFLNRLIMFFPFLEQYKRY